MSYETKNPAGAKELLDAGEWAYLDVRSTMEFAEAHPEGAFNIPLAEVDATGQMSPNADFLAAVQKNFPADARLIVGCAAGGRSARACEMLVSAGFQNLVNMHGGFSGARDMSGQVTEAGWQSCGFPTSNQPAPNRSYEDLR